MFTPHSIYVTIFLRHGDEERIYTMNNSKTSTVEFSDFISLRIEQNHVSHNTNPDRLSSQDILGEDNPSVTDDIDLIIKIRKSII